MAGVSTSSSGRHLTILFLPYVVGEKIREIVDGGTWKLRHPVGPDAEGFLAWRASMSDEQWVEWGALSDEQTLIPPYCSFQHHSF